MSALIREIAVPCAGQEPPEMVRLRSYALPRWNGLAIHYTPLEERSRLNPLWFTVTHARSGLAVLKFIEGIGTAWWVVNMLAEVGDWTRSAAEIRSDTAFCGDVRLRCRALEFWGVGHRSETAIGRGDDLVGVA